MNNLKKALLILCVILLTGLTALGTFALLTDKSDTVTNTYTVGNVSITLDESRTDMYGTPLRDTGEKDDQGNPIYVATTWNAGDADRVTSNTYKLVPGHRYRKDPTIHVSAGSEDCWLFVSFEGWDEAVFSLTQGTGWVYYDDHWAYSSTASAGDNIRVLTQIMYNENRTDTRTDAIRDFTITAYAVQREGFGSAEAAWNATFGKTQTP